MTRDRLAGMNLKRVILLASGPVAAAVVFMIVAESIHRPDAEPLILGFPGRLTAAMTAWMAVWWVSEAVPIYITALLPMLLLPTSGVQSSADIAEFYGHRIVYFAVGGFLLAAAIEKWALHKRFAFAVIGMCGNCPRNLIAGFMLASALLSMWISNTATAIIMLPVAMSIVRLVDDENPHYNSFAVCLLLSISYACSIGGMGTLIGTGTNMFFAAWVEGTLERSIGFVDWMSIAVPIVIVLLPVAWLLMTRVIFRIPASAETLQLDTTGLMDSEPWNTGQVLTLAIFVCAALLWMFVPILRELPGLQNLTDTAIAIAVGILLFVIPADKSASNTLMDWRTAANKVPWGILLLIGGGLCMAQAVIKFGVAELMAYQLETVNTLPTAVVILCVVALMVFLTEFSSNIASVTALTPVFAAFALSRDMDPLGIVIPITIAASCAFMLPAATLTNSVIMGSGMIKGYEMARAGLLLNLVAIAIISLRFAWGI